MQRDLEEVKNDQLIIAKKAREKDAIFRAAELEKKLKENIVPRTNKNKENNMTIFDDVMIDIETMGNSSNASMIQLAAVYFNRNTGELGQEFCVNIDENSCKALGFVSDQNTIDWWQEQDQNILNNIRSSSKPIMQAITEFHAFYKIGAHDVNVWSHATFDFVIVQNYLQKIGKYMNHRRARDIRTLVDLSQINLDLYDWSNKMHNALDDCKFQIKYCVDAINNLKKNN